MQSTDYKLETTACKDDVFQVKQLMMYKADKEDLREFKKHAESEFMYRKKAREINEELMF